MIVQGFLFGCCWYWLDDSVAAESEWQQAERLGFLCEGIDFSVALGDGVVCVLGETMTSSDI